MKSRVSVIAWCAALLATALSGAHAARAATPNCESWTGSQPASPSSQQNQLLGAAVLSYPDPALERQVMETGRQPERG